MNQLKQAVARRLGEAVDDTIWADSVEMISAENGLDLDVAIILYRQQQRINELQQRSNEQQQRLNELTIGGLLQRRENFKLEQFQRGTTDSNVNRSVESASSDDHQAFALSKIPSTVAGQGSVIMARLTA